MTSQKSKPIVECLGPVEVNGIWYEVDWPCKLDNPSEHDDFLAIYRDQEQVGEVYVGDRDPSEYGSILDTYFLELARDYIEEEIA